jgi:hypothetical protein
LLGFTLAAISELSREVFLPDQSSADTKSMKKRWQELNLWIFVHDCARNFRRKCGEKFLLTYARGAAPLTWRV